MLGINAYVMAFVMKKRHSPKGTSADCKTGAGFGEYGRAWQKIHRLGMGGFFGVEVALDIRGACDTRGALALTKYVWRLMQWTKPRGPYGFACHSG